MNQDRIKKVYPMLTSNLKQTNICEYELGIILVTVEEYKNSYRQVFVHEATDDGTVVEFVAMLDKKEKEEFKCALVDLVKEFKDKYDGWDISSLLNID